MSSSRVAIRSSGIKRALSAHWSGSFAVERCWPLVSKPQPSVVERHLASKPTSVVLVSGQGQDFAVHVVCEVVLEFVLETPDQPRPHAGPVWRVVLEESAQRYRVWGGIQHYWPNQHTTLQGGWYMYMYVVRCYTTLQVESYHKLACNVTGWIILWRSIQC